MYHGYEERARALRAQVTAVSGTDPYAGDCLVRWVDLIECLRELSRIAGHPAPGEPLMPVNAVRAILAPVRLDVPVQKMRFHHAARVVAGELGSLIAAGRLTVKADVTRATGLVEAFTTGYPRIGWRLQGSAFRLCFETDPLVARGPGDWGKIEDEARCYTSFFDFGAVQETVPDAGPVVPSVANGQCAFRHFQPSFVYQHVRVPAITLEHVQRLGTEYARRALDARASGGL